ncbi:MAG: hypothetical protein ACKV19_00375 [Verrucomicrobiales bacterium]
MKSSIVLPLVLLSGLAGGYVMGRRVRVGGEASAVSVAAKVGPGVPAVPSGKSVEVRERKAVVAATGAVAARGGPVVQRLLADFDRRKPIESKLRMLQRILAASPEEVGEMVRGMSGRWRNDPGWREAREAAVQRWVAVAPDEALAWVRSGAREGGQQEGPQVLGALAAIDPERALKEARHMGSSQQQREAMQSVLHAIAQFDPQRAMQMSEGLPGQIRGGVVSAVFDSWAGRDPSGAAAAAMELKETNQRMQAIQTVMHHFTEHDPTGALSWVRSLPEAGMRQNMMRQFFGQLAHRDPEQALALTADLPKHQQLQMQKEMIGGWARRDPEAAEQWILSRSNTIEQQQLILASVGQLTWGNPERSAALVSKLASGSARDNALQELVRMWHWSDSTAAQEFTRTLPEVEQQRLRSTIAESLAWRSPDEAIAFLKDNPLDDPAHHAWSNLAGAIADQSSPEKALEWARGLEDEATRMRAMPEIFSRMAMQDPAAAAREVASLPPGASREESLARIGGAWAGTNFEDALVWARSLTGKDRESALGTVLTQGAMHQPDSAARQYGDLLASVPAGEKPADSFVNAAASIAGAYFAEDQSKAAAWVSGLPQEDARAAASRALAQHWLQYDAPSASEWIGTLPQGKARDEAVKSLVSRIAASDPAMAFEWAATVGDESGRASSLEAALRSWRKMDADAARTAISSVNWPDEEKARWMEKLR